MPGLNDARLVLISCTSAEPSTQGLAETVHRVGTGYFISADLVLTASHVVPGRSESISLRVEAGAPRWRHGCRVVWRDEKLDAALVQVDEAIPASTASIEWAAALPDQNQSWSSAGYADAAAVESAEAPDDRKSAGLDGTLYAHGGGGQGERELDLGVNNAAPSAGWAGISGAPVFVGDRLFGLVKSVPTGFRGNRLSGVPAPALFQNPGFRLAIAPRWLKRPADGPWVLVLPSESEAAGDLSLTVRGSVERHDEALTKVLGQSLENRVVEVPIAEALASPERWLQFVEALCRAPIMVADVTGFDPAVMLALGIRAVVRRGLTIATTANMLDETQLSQLPFNIQETKLISHGDSEPGMNVEHPRFSLNIIARTIAEGVAEVRANPRYLDLPAYDAVRCPAPESPSDQQRARETLLVLCSFHKEYSAHWQKLSFALVKRYPTKRIVRMVDIASPRLVGQALYEHIRWAKTCLVDWTHWRPNVFFELGVRLACSNIEPVSVIEDGDPTERTAQKTALLQLFRPVPYRLASRTLSLAEALDPHEAIKEGGTPPRAVTQLPQNGTYLVSLNAFDYSQERVAASPHEMLRAAAEVNLGKDPQKIGETPVLFAANPAFSPELWRSVREQWIAAWLYLRHRYPESRVQADRQLQADLKRIGDSLLQWVRDDPADPSIKMLRDEVFALVRAWGPSIAPELLAQIRDLKTRAKNERDFARYSDARTLLNHATAIARKELDGLDRAKQPDSRKTVASELADCYGLLGGVERRWALQSTRQSNERREHLQDSINAYDEGFEYEDDPEYSFVSTYNALNRLLGRLLLDRGLLAPEALATGLRGDRFSVRTALERVAAKIQTQNRDDYWSQADVAVIDLILEKQSAVAAYAGFVAKRPPDFAYQSAIDGLSPLIDADLPMVAELERAREHLKARLAGLHAQ
jgi:hypothetical protein